MEPRTRLEKQVDRLSKSLPPISSAQIKYGIEHCFDKFAFPIGKNKWCTHCGKSFSIEKGINHKTIRCPHCNNRLNNQEIGKRVFQQKSYYSVITTCKGFQVCRHYLFSIESRKGKNPIYDYTEVCQEWIDRNGKKVIIARNLSPNMMYRDAWVLDSKLSIKIDKFTYYSPYCIYAYCIYPYIKVIPEIKRNGYKSLLDIAPSRFFTALLKDNEAELLLKCGQIELFKHKFKRGLPERYRDSILIACRHKYIINDAPTYLDYLDLLKHFNLDLHNPHYICPKDLNSEHHRLLTKKNVEITKSDEEKYSNDKGRYFGLCFTNEEIKITPIQSVLDMKTEGDLLHHCVYQNEYYKKENSLILSAQDNNGKRIETIEVDLKSFTIIQSRGSHNTDSPQHTMIIDLVKENMGAIINITRKEKLSTAC